MTFWGCMKSILGEKRMDHMVTSHDFGVDQSFRTDKKLTNMYDWCQGGGGNCRDRLWVCVIEVCTFSSELCLLLLLVDCDVRVRFELEKNKTSSLCIQTLCRTAQGLTEHVTAPYAFTSLLALALKVWGQRVRAFDGQQRELTGGSGSLLQTSHLLGNTSLRHVVSQCGSHWPS